jgi:hypothetical protein
LSRAPAIHLTHTLLGEALTRPSLNLVHEHDIRTAQELQGA